MTLKQYLIIGALSAAALFGGWLVYQTLSEELAVQRATIDAQAAEIRTMKIVSDADRKASQARDTAQKQAVKKLKESNAKLNTALEANPAWADDNVPCDVSAALGVFDPACESKPASDR